MPRTSIDFRNSKSDEGLLTGPSYRIAVSQPPLAIALWLMKGASVAFPRSIASAASLSLLSDDGLSEVSWTISAPVESTQPAAAIAILKMGKRLRIRMTRGGID